MIQANTKVNKELPYTGDEGSYAGVGMLLGLLGFLGIKKTRIDNTPVANGRI